MNFTMFSQDANSPSSVNTMAKLPDFPIILPCVLVLIGIIGSLLYINSMFKIYRPDEMFFMSKASYMSVAILTCANFQFFGVFMVLGLNYAP
jgi:hypothetical protein